MVKAINKQVLEIHDTGCDCFEKALFFVSPQYSEESEERLKKTALRTIQDSSGFPKTRKQKAKNRLTLFSELTISALAGAGITALIFLVL